MPELIVLSHFQADALLRAREQASSLAVVSLDLGLTERPASLEAERVLLPGGQWLPWEDVENIADSETACFVVVNNAAFKIQRFSDYLNRFYGLMPTERAPTLLVSGIAMHRIQGTTPDRDTLAKIRAVAPLVGRVLDTCTGLGYTAIEAAKTADEVVTIELDPAVLEVARLNPWSQQLFENPKIRQVVGDAFEEIEGFEDEGFARIIHDPPRFSLAGELYSGEFYRSLCRVLARKGRLFHYIGDPDSRSGRNVTKGVVRRLGEAGFSRIVRKPGAFGLLAIK